MKFNRYEKEIISNVIRLVNIPSIYDENTITEKTPFGKHINICLDETLKLCEELGLKTYKDLAGYYGYAEIGAGQDYIGIMCHLDVVPPGDLSTWKSDPFKGELRNGEIYGRGTGDDKGPTIAAIYAVKAILDSKINLKKRIRLMFLTDEETLWRGIDRYKESEQEPIFAFAADGYFPFTYAEKGLLQLTLKKDKKESDIIFNGGENYNSVAYNAVYKGELTPLIATKIDNQEIKYKITNNEIEIIGIPAHASKPELGKNAVLYLANIFKEIGIQDNHIKLLTEVFNYDVKQTKLFDKQIVDRTGEISVNIGAIDMTKDIAIKLDMRLPVTYQKEDIIKQVKDKVIKYGFSIEFRSYLNPLYVSLDSPFTKILLDTYQEISKDYESKPIINGGATFARAYPDRAVCFGVKFNGKPSYAHEPNERIDIESLIKGTEIYYETLKKLNKLDKI
jgi:predicted dipeptidase